MSMSPPELYLRRVRLRLSQEQLAVVLDLTQQAVSLYELGERPIPSRVVETLAEYELHVADQRKRRRFAHGR